MTITEFLQARIAEDEAVAQAAIADDVGSDEGFSGQYESLVAPPSGVGLAQGGFGEAAALMIATYAVPSRVLAECEAKRRVVELHKAWPVLVETPPTFATTSEGLGVNSVTFRASQQIQWLTQEEYRKRFGSEPPTAPMLAAMATVYADHPDYREEWRVS